MFADVSFPISSYQTFSYEIPATLLEKVSVGVRVNAMFGHRKIQGIVVDLKDKTEFKGRIKTIESLVDDQPVLDRYLWKLINWLSEYYSIPLGVAVKAALPVNLSTRYKPHTRTMIKATGPLSELPPRAKAQTKVLEHLLELKDFVATQSLNTLASNPLDICRKLADKGLAEIKEEDVLPDLNGFSFKPIHKKIRFTDCQNKAIEKICYSLDNSEFKPFLLHGVTGSGKTEIYIAAARHALNQGRTVIMLLPEISLTPQIAGRFRAVFGDAVALWHSKLSQSARAWTWKKICAGDYKVVIGARSAIFVPLKNLGLIVVDEEQESSYKQESPDPRYHARDVALMRGKIHNGAVVLASATPSLESYYNYIQGKHEYIHLPDRFGGAKYPHVHLVDMIKESEEREIYGGIFSRLLLEKIEDRINKKEQVILLHNRRGYAPVLRCADCGEVAMCPNCQVALTYHRTGNFLQCHFCGHIERSLPSTCKKCQSFNIQLAGTGTQKVEDELKDKFSSAKIERLDVDTARSGINITDVLQRFAAGQINILLGTQMIAKGLDFVNATLVGIINGDTGLYLPDFRAGERVFQLIYQAAGRSGRGRIPGEVVVQTYNKENPVIKCATQLDLKKYYNICLDERQALDYPPFSWMVRLEILDKNKNAVEKASKFLGNKFNRPPKGITLLGPAFCYRERLRNQYRMQVVLKSRKELDPNGQKLHQYYKSIIKNGDPFKLPGNVRLIIDVNPVSLL
ncbi:MAG: primosomal protein N' [Candidatus Marinimicrobia bacterium]|nr:primosomal protein N' [Candidatus Neomarinimicrobiota bacterium]